MSPELDGWLSLMRNWPPVFKETYLQRLAHLKEHQPKVYAELEGKFKTRDVLKLVEAIK